MKLLWNTVLIASIAGCLADPSEHGEGSSASRQDGGEAETSLAVTAAAPAFHFIPMRDGHGPHDRPTHSRAMGNCSIYRAP